MTLESKAILIVLAHAAMRHPEGKTDVKAMDVDAPGGLHDRRLAFRRDVSRVLWKKQNGVTSC